MPREPHSQLTDAQLLEADTSAVYGTVDEYFGQFIQSMAHGRAADAGPHRVKSIEVQIDRKELGPLANRVRALRGAINPEVEKYLK